MRFLLLSLLFFLSFSASAANLQGVGVFETLNKPWFMVGLYVDKNQPQEVSRLEFRVVEQRISQQRFRQLWVEALAVAHEDSTWKKYEEEFEQFFSILQGPLKANDHLELERSSSATVLKINLREHAQFSPDFIEVLATSMIGKIVLSPQLKTGLLGELPRKEANQLLRSFERMSPSLGRIAETSRWLRTPTTAVNNLASTPNS